MSNLPPLPKPTHNGWSFDGHQPQFSYTASQMHAYAKAALREALAAQLEQEPVAWLTHAEKKEIARISVYVESAITNTEAKLREIFFTEANGFPQEFKPKPAAKPEQPLTDEEMYLAIRPLFKTDALAQAALNISKDEYRAIEAAHGIKEQS